MRLIHPRSAHVVECDPDDAGIYIGQGWLDADPPVMRTPRKRPPKRTTTARASGQESGTAPRTTTTKEEA